MKILSIKQPWVDAILDLGKDIENREWPTNYRGAVLLHSSRTVKDSDYLDDLITINDIEPKAQFIIKERSKKGFVLGIATIIDCVTSSDSKWFFGTYGFVLAHVLKLPNPIAYKGQLGLKEVSDLQLLEDVYNQLNEYSLYKKPLLQDMLSLGFNRMRLEKE